ncbi:YfhO family protein [Carnobacterium sp.]|uniref:YfhO family protein n=1 Tax=Carnobacterium sp. TaxID=48221 RepID=UPI0028AE4528|nr:YfhO family protein [Carnobacterium sp.]
MGDQRKSIYQSDLLSFSSYIPRKKMLFHLGYQTSNQKNQTISLQFDRIGSYDLANIQVLTLPLDDAYQQRVKAKKENALTITTFKNEEIKGTVYQEKDSVLTTTIPFTSGWQAEVNGKPVDTIRVNEGFVGVPLDKGQSKITFTYQTPFLKAGMAATFLGVLLTIVNQMVQQKRRKNN